MLKVQVLTPKQIIYQSEASAVSSRNSVGNFDILPGHANFITLINDRQVVIRLGDGTEKKFDFSLAVIHCTNDKVSIYSDITAGLL